MSVRPVLGRDSSQVTNKETNKEKSGLSEEGSKADAVAKKTLKAPKKTSKKKMKCQYVNPDTEEKCCKRIPFYLQSIICRCGKHFCPKHLSTISHDCKVLPPEREQAKAGYTSFRGRSDTNCVA